MRRTTALLQFKLKLIMFLLFVMQAAVGRIPRLRGALQHGRQRRRLAADHHRRVPGHGGGRGDQVPGDVRGGEQVRGLAHEHLAGDSRMGPSSEVSGM